MRRFILVLCLGIAGSAVCPIRPANATFPGDNGRITFFLLRTPDRTEPIASMNPDGSDRTVLVRDHGSYPAWSADGTTIAYVKQDVGLMTMSANGTNKTLLLPEIPERRFLFERPTWSPDGTQIAFDAVSRDYFFHIFVVNADGTDPVKLDLAGQNQYFPDWSPNGSRIVFTAQGRSEGGIRTVDPDGENLAIVTDFGSSASWSPDGSEIVFRRGRRGDVVVINADGTGLVRLTDTSRRREGLPVFSPDGTEIAFSRSVGRSRKASTDIWVMNADGTSPTRITDTPRRSEFGPSWRST